MGFCDVGGKDFCSNCAAHGVIDGRRVGIYMSELSASWMAVPFALVGLGEAFVLPALYHLSNAYAPERTRSVVQSVQLVYNTAVPAALMAGLSRGLREYFPNNLNAGRLEVFYMLAIAVLAAAAPL